MSCTESGDALCGYTTALVGTSLASTVLYAQIGGTGRTAQAAIAGTPLASTMSFAEAALFCILLTARWVLAPRAHDKKHKSKIIAFSLSLPL